MTTSTLLLRLEGPMQAWGTHGAFWEQRPTMPRPTKSGVIGLAAAVLGRDYTDPISDLAALTFSVRADRPGEPLSDFQTAGGGTFPTPNWMRPTLPESLRFSRETPYGAPRGLKRGTNGASANVGWDEKDRRAVMIYKSYLVDAAFMAALTGPQPLIEALYDAFHQPARAPFLGRLCCPPSEPIPFDCLDGDEQHHWAEFVPSLDPATHSPAVLTVWTEDTHGPIFYEQPGATVRDWLPMHITTRTVTPPKD